MIKLFSSLPLSSLLQPVEWYHYIANLINPAHQLPDLKVGEMYAEVAEYTQAGNFWDFIWGNVTLGQKATFRYDRKESPFLNKDTDYLRNLFCSSLCSEIVSAKAIRIGKSTPTQNMPVQVTLVLIAIENI